MGQISDMRPSSLDGSYSSDSGSASGADLVIPSPNLLSSVSPELGTQPGQSAQPALADGDEPGDLVSSSGEEEDERPRDEPGDLVSSSGEEEDERPRFTYYGQREREALDASRAAHAAAVTARRRMRLRLEDDSDEEEPSSSTRPHARSKVHVADDLRASSKKRAQVVDDDQDPQGTESDESEEEEQDRARTPRRIKVAWEHVKDYDRNKIPDVSIFEDISQVMQNSLKDANFYSENVEQRLPTDMGYFKQTHVRLFSGTLLISARVTDSIFVNDSITRAKRIRIFRTTFTSAHCITNADVWSDFRCGRRFIK